MTFQKIFRRAVLFVNTPLLNQPNKMHCFVVLTDPVKCPNTGLEQIAWVSWESYTGDPRISTNCILDVGDYLNIKWKSVVNYSFAAVRYVNEIESKIENGIFNLFDEPISEEVYKRILHGLYLTEELTDPDVEKFCRLHAPVID